MEPLLLVGYSLIFIGIFIYTLFMRRRIKRLEQRVADLRDDS
ncbi:CcmD family protein [Halorutilales archaeon Cl-col2-1]|nr:CcmD family protein [Halobacteria archaeon]